MKLTFKDRYGGKVLLIGRTSIKASAWPWQKGFNWQGRLESAAPLNQPAKGKKAAARFGGGWYYDLGVRVGGTTVLVSLLFGYLRITRLTEADAAELRRRPA